MFSPCSHFSKISVAFGLNLGLSVNYQRRAWVSVTKFMDCLYTYFAIKRFLCRVDIFISNFYTL